MPSSLAEHLWVVTGDDGSGVRLPATGTLQATGPSRRQAGAAAIDENSDANRRKPTGEGLLLPQVFNRNSGIVKISFLQEYQVGISGKVI
jgi:hypothetical protein